MGEKKFKFFSCFVEFELFNLVEGSFRSWKHENIGTNPTGKYGLFIFEFTKTCTPVR